MSRAFRDTFGQGRRLAIFLNVLLMVALAGAAAGIAVYLTGFTDLRRRFDLTAAGTYTLRPESALLLEGLAKDVEVVTVFDRVPMRHDPDGVRFRAMDYTTDLLQEYKVRGRGRVSVENLDPRIDHARVSDLVRDYNLTRYDTVIVRCGSNRRLLGLETDLAEFGGTAPESGGRGLTLRSMRAEEALSSAIFEVTSDERARVYVLSGHGELSLNSGSPGAAGMFGSALQGDNLEVQPLSLLAQKSVPADADAVVVLGLQQPLLPEEIEALDAYLRRAGRLLLALDPLGDRSLDPILERLGVDFERNVICHDQGGVLKNETPMEMHVGGGAPGTFGAHAIVAPLIEANLSMVVLHNGALGARPDAATTFTSLLLSHPDAFGDAPVDGRSNYLLDDPRVEKKGQRTLAAAIEPRGDYAGARVVLCGGVFLFTSHVISRQPGNDQFGRRAVAWLCGKSKHLQIMPRTFRANVAELKPDEYDAIFAYTVIWMPAAAALLALAVWWLRRR